MCSAYSRGIYVGIRIYTRIRFPDLRYMHVLYLTASITFLPCFA